MTAAQLSGLDQVDLRWHISAAISDWLDHLEDRHARSRCDATNRFCEHPHHTITAQRAHNLVTDLDETARAFRRAWAKHVEGATGFLERHHELTETLKQAIVDLDDITACTHVCPRVPRLPGDITNAAWELLDRLEAAGYQFTRGRR